MSLSFAASPMGKRIGISVASVGDRQLVVTVSPKAWREDATRQQFLTKLSPGSTELALFEGDRVHFSDPDAETEATAVAALRASRSGTGLWKDGDSLLVPDVPMNFPGENPASSRPAPESTAHLLRLFQRIELFRSTSDSPFVRERNSSLYRPLAVRHFLDEVEARLHQTRRGYRRITEDRWTVRGRVKASSVGLNRATGGTKVTCTYDELTESTQLLGAIVTALELIAEGHGPSSLLPKPFNEKRLRSDAVRLRRALEAVEALPLSTVLNTLTRLRPTRLDQPWQTALRLAGVVIRGGALVAKAGRDRQTQAVELSVPTDKVWESIVNQALKRAGIGQVLDQTEQSARFDLNRDPWVSRPGGTEALGRPDNVVLRADSTVVVDAKYKLTDQPSLADRYQMFAYSHLVRSGRRPVGSVVLVYPGSGATTVQYRGRDTADDAVRLVSVQLPFPAPSDVATAHLWDGYLGRVSKRLAEQADPSI
ncbi:5-methylcytosine restriction system specificity protein McrC [Nocardioides stalactiti]|uniref:5-methylcytosine restriction system specificity protein McrC n=1 Tax=Nocardioides stalactiti TaxID=2755356 RepID=UPI0016003543|nr:hypothetical protein [Nocardioides stalactiti]